MDLTYGVPGICSACEVCSGICCPLKMVDVRALVFSTSAVKDSTRDGSVFVSDETDVDGPSEDAVAPLFVSRIASESRKTTGELVEVAIANRVHIVVAGIKGKDLPAQATRTSLVVPTLNLLVEDGDGNIGPGSVQIGEHLRREA